MSDLDIDYNSRQWKEGPDPRRKKGKEAYTVGDASPKDSQLGKEHRSALLRRAELDTLEIV